MNHKRRITDITDHIDVSRAVSILMDKITSTETTQEELYVLLNIQNDLLKLTMNRVQDRREAYDKQ